MLLNFRVFVNFLVCYWCLVWFDCSERIYSLLFSFKFVEMCFMDQEMDCLGEYFTGVWKTNLLCCFWLEWYMCQIPVFDYGVQIYILGDFYSVVLSCWQSIVKVLNNNDEILSNCFSSISFCFMHICYLVHSLLGLLYRPGALIPILSYNIPLCLWSISLLWSLLY